MSYKNIMLALFSIMRCFLTCDAVDVSSAQVDPLLVVTIMVKDEEGVIVESIEPYVQGGVEAFLIYDTGSRDKTIERITDYFNNNGISRFVIEQEPFVDFATSRNRALSLAERHFPNAGFFIMPDAEWYVNGIEVLLKFCQEQLANEAVSLYCIEIFCKGNSNHFTVPRLFRANAHIRFAGRVHEIPFSDKPTVKVPNSVWIKYHPSDYGDEKTLKRIPRDIAWLLKEYEEDPNSTRALYYLAQEYTVLGEYHQAINYFKKRIALADQIGEPFEEEHFVALLRMGQIYEQLFFRGEARWEDAENAFIEALLYRPGRSEPLIHLANHYMHSGNVARAYIYSISACKAAYPHADTIAINKVLYDFDRWNILARVAFKLGKWQEAESAAYTALQARPESQVLYDIIRLCRVEIEKHQLYA